MNIWFWLWACAMLWVVLVLFWLMRVQYVWYCKKKQCVASPERSKFLKMCFGATLGLIILIVAVAVSVRADTTITMTVNGSQIKLVDSENSFVFTDVNGSTSFLWDTADAEDINVLSDKIDVLDVTVQETCANLTEIRTIIGERVESKNSELFDRFDELVNPLKDASAQLIDCTDDKRVMSDLLAERRVNETSLEKDKALCKIELSQVSENYSNMKWLGILLFVVLIIIGFERFGGIDKLRGRILKKDG